MSIFLAVAFASFCNTVAYLTSACFWHMELLKEFLKLTFGSLESISVLDSVLQQLFFLLHLIILSQEDALHPHFAQSLLLP